MDLDPVIHVQARLRVVVALDALPPDTSLSFSRLREMLDLTPGNLITHLRKLEEADYVTSVKNGKETLVSLTPRGRLAFTDYRRTLTQLLGS